LETSGQHKSNEPIATNCRQLHARCSHHNLRLGQSKLSPKTRVGDHVTRQTDLANTNERVDLFRHAEQYDSQCSNFFVLRLRENAVATINYLNRKEKQSQDTEAGHVWVLSKSKGYHGNSSHGWFESLICEREKKGRQRRGTITSIISLSLRGCGCSVSVTALYSRGAASR